MDYTRQSDIITTWLIQNTEIALIGTGGIGAITALGLAKMGTGHLLLYDFDTVEAENIPTQFLKVSDIGKKKVTSVATMLKEFSDVTGIAYSREVDRLTHLTSDIVIASVDSIRARQEIWWAIAGKWSILTRPKFYLDARMGAQIFQLYTVNYQDSEWYAAPLLDLREEDVPDEPCTAKATIFTALLAAGHICNAVKRIVMDQPQPRFIQHDIVADRLLVSQEIA